MSTQPNPTPLPDPASDAASSAASNAASGQPARRAQPTVYYVRNQAVTVPAGYLAVGQVVGVHGLHGELKVEPYTDNPERFAAGNTLLLGDDLEPVTVASMRPHKSNLLVRCAEIDGREAAEDCRGLWFFVAEQDAAALDAGAYWIHDIIGLTVVSDSGETLGKIVDVLATGANDVYVVRPGAGSRLTREWLLPAIEDVIERVDLEHGEMHIRLLEGLLDE